MGLKNNCCIKKTWLLYLQSSLICNPKNLLPYTVHQATATHSVLRPATPHSIMSPLMTAATPWGVPV